MSYIYLGIPTKKTIVIINSPNILLVSSSSITDVCWSKTTGVAFFTTVRADV